jgi:hypothetical protein
VVPWLVYLAIFGAGAVALDGLERALAVGAFWASSLGALLAMSQLRRTLSSMRSWMGDRESALSTFADDRAATVARQFQWAVEELVRARAELRTVEGMRLQAEERAKGFAHQAREEGEELRVARERLNAMDAGELDILRTRIEQLEEALVVEERDRRAAERRARTSEQRVAELTRTLRLVANTVSPDADRPSKVRVLDATGRIVVESDRPQHRNASELLLRIPQSVAAAVESVNWTAFQLEAEVDEVWEPAALIDRAKPVVDSEVMEPRALRIVS